ncbi:unnamed protein product [Amoebophrya sp. A25]|nr:unnamed protein product [Amoebophrya sp. A25]|eukprot:GSA25T00011750001.1
MSGDIEFKLNELDTRYKNDMREMTEKVKFLEKDNNSLRRKLEDHDDELRSTRRKMASLQASSNSLESTSHDVRRVEWTIPGIRDRLKAQDKGMSIWSPEFSARGINGIQLEFFPNGRESTTITGFCSLFLWCPSGTKIKYQLSVGKHMRAPDEDTYDGRMGHGHSNFCMLEAEITQDSVTVAVDILEVEKTQYVQSDLGSLQIYTGAVRSHIDQEAQILTNRNISRVEWRLINMEKKLANLPRGSSIYSPIFSAAGIREILLEFYPNGSQNTTKDGACAFYIRCPEGTSIVVTLFVGNYKKGPIVAHFDGSAGKGLPDFCEIAKEIEDDQLVLGLELQNQALEKEMKRSTLHLTS